MPVPVVQRALQRFADENRDWCARLAESLRQGNGEAARRQAHTLKGLARFNVFN